ncbi:MAG TPA: methyltransferase domain-containing protein [Cyclobacteriaceae bacterium]|nr:methyltransferase domain-containing protein [Cyclobacteriaceae bacterium]
MRIKIARGSKEDGIVIGNAFDKYGSSNPIVRKIMNGFDRELNKLVERVNPKDLHEVGCGEGYWIIQWYLRGINARGSDFSTQVINMAKENAVKNSLPEKLFSVRSIYDFDEEEDRAELIVCCEVLEHLENPEAALLNLQKITGKYVIISVPREPIWRILNMMRAKYLAELGNTPGHIQHWTKNGIVKLAANYFDVVEISTPFPWTMMLCRSRGFYEGEAWDRRFRLK